MYPPSHQHHLYQPNADPAVRGVIGFCERKSKGETSVTWVGWLVASTSPPYGSTKAVLRLGAAPRASLAPTFPSWTATRWTSFTRSSTQKHIYYQIKVMLRCLILHNIWFGWLRLFTVLPGRLRAVWLQCGSLPRPGTLTAGAGAVLLVGASSGS